MNNCCPTPLVQSTPPGLEGLLGFTTGGQNIPGLLSLVFPGAATIGGFEIEDQKSLLSLVWPELISFRDAYMQVSDNAVLNSISLPALQSTSGFGTFNMSNNPLLSVLHIPALASSRSFTFSGNNTFMTFSAPMLASMSGSLLITSNAALSSISLPALLSVVGALTLQSNVAMTSLTLTALQSLTQGFSISSNAALTTLSLPALMTVASASGSFNCANATLLATVSFPNYLPVNGRNQTFSGCALSQASVDHILARAVANAAYVSGTINTSGGTSAAPSATGATDKATLAARGVTVTTN